jgi:hypothetical protein
MTGQASAEGAAPAPFLRLRSLTLVEDGDAVVVGDPESGTYVSVPQVGAAIIRALQEGASIRQAARAAAELAGEPVDADSFVAGLRELGFVDDGEDRQPLSPVRTAPIQQRHWLSRVSPRLARPAFTSAAWCCYASALVFCAVVFIVRPGLWPRPGQVFVVANDGLSVLLLVPISTVLAGLHEAWHWLAARAAGVAARYGIDRRGPFLVFETDLSQLWSIPRRKRYGPQLAGLAVDSAVLAGLLGFELSGPAAGSLPARLAAAFVFVIVVQMLWQCMIFLRTDLYAVLVTVTGTRNLWEVKSLLLRRAAGRLGAAERQALASADPRDVAIGRWFRWVYLAGQLGVLWYFLAFFLPILSTAFRWTGHGLAAGPERGEFWLVLGSSVAAYAWIVLVIVIAARQLVASLVARRRPAG